jgi:O-antigen biosynthesis protein
MRIDEVEIPTSPLTQTETGPQEIPAEEEHLSYGPAINQSGKKNNVNRLAAIFRLVHIAGSDPLLTLRMANFRFFKNFVRFLIVSDVDGSHIIDKYEKIYSIPYPKNGILTRTTAILRLLFIALSKPGITIRLLSPRLLKKTIRFLFNNEGDADRILNNYRNVYNISNTDGMTISHADAKMIADHYGLDACLKNKQPPKCSPGELSVWTTELKTIANALPEKESSVSIIIPVHNNIRYTLACIHSIFINAGRYDFEIIIADDLSTDETLIAFEEDFRRVRYLRNENNLGFLNNCNKAAEAAKGRYLVFLNNDIIVLKGWLTELIKPLEDYSDIGLVGSKLIYPDGRLQEAGGIIFDDGGGWNYGRYDNPGKPIYNYMRNADYCSGASIAVSSDMWRHLGGFDQRFSPAYYEDTDFAFQVRKFGKRVVYNPLSEAIHFEGISHGTDENECGKQYQPVNKIKFFHKWNDILPEFGSCSPPSLPAERNIKGRILIVDAVTPMPDRDSGSVDAFNYMKILKNIGYHITFLPENLQYCGNYTNDLRRLGVECAHLPFFSDLKKALVHYAPLSDYVFLYRAPVAHPLIDTVRKSAPHAKIIFNTVDLHFLREEREAQVNSSPFQHDLAKRMREIELEVVRKADATILLSRYEIDLLNELLPEAKLFYIPIVREIPESSGAPRENRQDILFIGGFNHPPNIDAVIFFVNNVWPHLKKSGFPGRFIVAGSDMPARIKALSAENIIIRGYVPDLSEVFGSCRLSVAPIRYGAGMKGKVISSLSYGVPCVATSMAVEGTGLVHGENIMIADNPEEMARMVQQVYDDNVLWEKLSLTGLKYCVDNCSMDSVRQKLDFMLSELTRAS